MADGEGEGDPRESSNSINHVHDGRGQARSDGDEQESSSPDPLYSNSTSMGPSSAENGTNGMYSDESMDGQQDGPLDFSVRKNNSSIPIQNLYNKLTNGLHRKPQDHNKPRTKRDYEGSEDISKSPGSRQYERDVLEHTLKTEAITPPPHSNGLSPVSDCPGRNSVGNSPDVAKIGEPQIAVPGMLPGTGLPGGAAGLLPMFHAGMLPSSGVFSGLQLPHDLNGSSFEQNGKSSRSLKSNNKEQLSFPPPFGALPALPQMPGLDMVAAHAMAANSEEVFAHYKQYIMALQEQLLAQRSPGGSSTSSSSLGNHRQTGSMSGMHSPTGSGQEGTPIPASTGSNPFVTPTSPQSSNRPYVNRSGSSSRKRGKSLPDALKDEAYWERRRKNNDAAKRSRDSRRAKEDQIAIRAAFLEQENLKLRVEVTALKNETAKLRCMLYNS